MSDIRNIRSELERRIGQRSQLEKQLILSRRRCRELGIEEKKVQQALSIVQTVAQQTQQELEYHISEMTSLALQAVFPDPYKLSVEFNVARGKTEADLLFEKDGNKMHPLSASGGGAVDIASFGLRPSMWCLSQPRPRNVLGLDEPFKHLSVDLQPRAAAMIKEISRRLDLQIIMVSHIQELNEEADRVIHVTMRSGVSYVKQYNLEES